MRSPRGSSPVARAGARSAERDCRGVRRVLLAGATGLVGGELLAQLAADSTVSRVTAMVRRNPGPLPLPADRIRTEIVDFDDLAGREALFGVDQVFCALGTTRARAGSREAFRRVDFDYPLEIARLAREGGARHFLLVSALGADARSAVFYNRVKGELEEAVRALGFRSLTIVRPSLLQGERAEFRPVEALMKRLAWVAPRRYAPVHAGDVAGALVAAAREDAPGLRVIESADIPRA